MHNLQPSDSMLMPSGAWGGAVIGAINHFAQAGVAVSLFDYFAYPVAGALTSLAAKLAYDWIAPRLFKDRTKGGGL